MIRKNISSKKCSLTKNHKKSPNFIYSILAKPSSTHYSLQKHRIQKINGPKYKNDERKKEWKYSTSTRVKFISIQLVLFMRSMFFNAV